MRDTCAPYDPEKIRFRDVDSEGVTVSAAFLSPQDRQPTVDWLDGGTFSVLLDAAATGGQLGVGRFRVGRGEAPPYHKHQHEDEVFLLLSGTALLWCDDEELELSDGGIVFLPRNVPHGYRITSERADLLMMCTPGGFEGMFLQGGKPVGSGEPDTPALMAAAEAFGQVIVGPPR